jgi:hypothetical protein
MASALIWVGVDFAGWALYVAFLTRAGSSGAAALAGAILVIGPFGWALIIYMLPLRPKCPELAPSESHDVTLRLLAKVAEDKPLLAIVFAGILGASEAVLNRKQ